MRTKTWLAGALMAGGLAVAMLPSEEAEASSIKKASVYETITSSEFETLLRGHGLDATGDTTGSGSKISRYVHSGIKVSVYYYNCSGDECGSLQLYSGFAMTNKPSPDKIISWNMEKRYGRAYLDSDKDPCVEMDLDLTGGVTAAAMMNWVDVFGIIHTQFAEHVGFTD
jgi:hypothetical protein